MRNQTELPKDNAWSLRVLLERAEQRGDHRAARQHAQSLFEAEPNNRWALEKAVHAALRAGDGPMAIALATRGSERFGEPFETLTRRAESRRDQRSGYHWFLFAGMLLLLIVLLRKSRRHADGRTRRVGTRREVPTRQSHALDSPRLPRR
jgi:ferric-dicitrate binding protein FerR (iron transport regulator)